MSDEHASGALSELPQIATERTPLRSIRARGRISGTVALLGPAFVAAVAYVDPGNFATNVSAGARFGFLLVWVIVVANAMAMLVQYLSAKVGLATGQSLPELCHDHLPGAVNRLLWVQAELVAMATDLAEFVGAAIALQLLFGIPSLVAGGITAIVAFGILELQRRGHRPFEIAIAGLLALVALGLLYDLAQVPLDVPAVAGGLVPRLDGTASLLLGVGIIGATVMPHVVYLHSALTRRRVPPQDDEERRELLRFQRLDVVVALSVAGLVNLSMLVMAAEIFHGRGMFGVDTIEGAHAGLATYAGGGAALAFAVALLASGLSSSSVGTYAGQVVMQGFIRRRIPLFARRAVTMAPALLVLGLGLDPTATLILSQVVLSFGIPFALVPMIMLTRRREVMGGLVNRPMTTAAATVVAAVVIGLNLFLVGQVVLA